MFQSTTLAEAFFAVWPTILALDLARYLVAAGLVAALLALFAGPLAGRRIQQRLATRQDMRREIGYSLVTVLLFSVVGFSVYAGSQVGVFRIYGGELPGIGWLLLEFTVFMLVHDAYFYWLHRAMHTRWLFRAAHRLHHQSRTPTPWAAYAFAPLEALLEAAIMPLVALLMPVHEITAFLFVTHMIARNVVGHAGFELFPAWWLRAPLLRYVTTTTHHDLHHSSGRYNYGLYFTWWDSWMGTEHPEYVRRFDSAVASRGVSANTKRENTQ